MNRTLSRPRCRPRLETLEDRLVPSADLVLQWNDVMREAIRATNTTPNFGSRIMAITHTAIYDSVNALDRTHESFLVDALAHPSASREAAVAAAAHCWSVRWRRVGWKRRQCATRIGVKRASTDRR